MSGLLHDIRLAARSLGRAPGFAALAVLTVGLGIGASTTIFGVVDAVLLRPLPYPDPDRLAVVRTKLEAFGIAVNDVSPPEYRDFRSRCDAFEDLAAVVPRGVNLTGGSLPEHVSAALVTPSFFKVLGVQPAAGRAFLPEEEEPGRAAVVVLGHGLWQRRFGADPSLLGGKLLLDGEPHTVVGVMPAGFALPEPETELWAPLALTAEDLSEEERGSHYLRVIGRVKPGRSVARARASLEAVAAALERERADAYGGRGWGVRVAPLHDEMVGGGRGTLLLLLAAVGLVLLIGCANVANLLLVRAESRRRELTIRRALGATPWRLARLLLAECAALAATAGAVGVVLALWGIDAVKAVAPGTVGRLAEAGLDARAIGFAAAVSALTILLFGLLPALLAGAAAPGAALRDSPRGATEGRGRSRARTLLVGAEVAMACVLLAGAGLLARSLSNLLGVDPGLDPSGVLTARLSLPAAAYPDATRLRSFSRELGTRLESLPGVRAAGVVSHLPLAGGNWSRNFTVEGSAAAGAGPVELEIDSRIASPGYFAAMGVALLEGRVFDGRDGPLSPPVVVVDETLARRLWGEDGAVGRRIRPGGPDAEGIPWRTVIGVVRHVRHHRLDSPGREQIYFPDQQLPARDLHVVVRGSADPESLAPALDHAVRALDPELPLHGVATMGSRFRAALSAPRFRSLLLGLFAAAALVLASVGLYGVVAHTTGRRTQEIGVRMALGATGAQVVRMVVAQGMRPVIGGVAAGLALAAAAAWSARALLFGVAPADPATLGGVVVLLAAVAAAACWLPARRAARIDPAAALRCE